MLPTPEMMQAASKGFQAIPEAVHAVVEKDLQIDKVVAGLVVGNLIHQATELHQTYVVTRGRIKALITAGILTWDRLTGKNIHGQRGQIQQQERIEQTKRLLEQQRKDEDKPQQEPPQ